MNVIEKMGLVMVIWGAAIYVISSNAGEVMTIIQFVGFMTFIAGVAVLIFGGNE